MIFSPARFKKSVLQLPFFVQRFALVLVLMHTCNVLFNQSMIVLQEMRMSEKSDAFIPWMFAIAFLGFVVQSLTKVLWIFLVCYHFHHKGSVVDFLKKHTELGLIESLRAFFKALLWAFVFVIPGVVRMIRYQFVLFVVASSKKYEKGEMDALAGSEEITKGHFWGLSALLLLFASLLFFLSTTRSFFEAPVEVFVTEFFAFFFISLQGIYMFLLFQDLLRARGHE